MTCRVLALTVGLFVSLSLVSCTPYQEPLPPRDRLHFPVGMTLHPEGRYLYVVNSNFDTRYSSDLGGSISVVDTNSLTILGNQSPYLPSFGGAIRLNADATKAYVTARKNNVVVVLDVASGDGVRAGSALYCKDAQGNLSSDPTKCTVSRVPDVKGGALLPSDPFGLDVVTVNRTINEQPVSIDVLGISHLRGTQVSAMSFPNGQVSAASLVHAPLIEGANAVANRPGTLNMYAIGRNSSRMAIFAPYINERGQVEAIVNRGSVDLNHVTSTVDARGIAFNRAGDTVYVTTRRPDAVHIFDIVADNTETGSGTRHELRRSIYLPNQPSDVVLFEPAGRDPLLYVPCYDDKSIQIINPRTGAVVDEILLDASPYDLVIDPTDRRCRFDGDRCRAYVSLFSDTSVASQRCEDSVDGCGSVAVIELDPSSARYHNVIAKIR